jgi:hypothetical protein
MVRAMLVLIEHMLRAQRFWWHRGRLMLKKIFSKGPIIAASEKIQNITSCNLSADSGTARHAIF